MVILAVLATLVVAVALSAMLADAGVATDRLMTYTVAREANYMVARSAIEIGLEVLRADDNDTDGPGDDWAVGELNVEWEGKSVALRIVDEESRFPLNRLMAKPDDAVMGEALGRFAKIAGLREPDAAVDSLLDWADPDVVRRPSGAEMGDYGELRVKDGPMDSLAELRFLPQWAQPPSLPPPARKPPPQLEGLEGAQPEGTLGTVPVARQAASETLGGAETSAWSDWLTLHSEGKINVNTAPADLLRALDESMSDVTVQEIVNRREDEAFARGDDLRKVPGVDMDLLFRLEQLVGYRSNTFEIRATVDEPPGRITLKAVVRRGGGPMRVLWWEVQ